MKTEGPWLVVVLQLLVSEGVVFRIFSGQVLLLADPVVTILRKESGLQGCENKPMILYTEQEPAGTSCGWIYIPHTPPTLS